MFKLIFIEKRMCACVRDHVCNQVTIEARVATSLEIPALKMLTCSSMFCSGLRNQELKDRSWSLAEPASNLKLFGASMYARQYVNMFQHWQPWQFFCLPLLILTTAKYITIGFSCCLVMVHPHSKIAIISTLKKLFALLLNFTDWSPLFIPV